MQSITAIVLCSATIVCYLNTYSIIYIMTHFTTATIAILLAANSTAFTPSQVPVFRSIYSATANDETDYDAPVIVAAKPIELDHEIVVVDDECYLGKYGQYDECVDFGKFFCAYHVSFIIMYTLVSFI